MKNLSVLLLLVLPSLLMAQDGVEYQVPVTATVAVRSLEPDRAQPETPDFFASAWTTSTDTNIFRTLLKVDLSGIDPTWMIDYVALDLYGNPSSSRPDNAGFNDAWLERITEPWLPTTVTWQSQPASTPVNRISLDQSWVFAEDRLDLDVTAIVLDMLADPSASHGLIMRLQEESVFRSLVFASSEHPNPALHPTIRLYYHTEPDTTTTTGLDAPALDFQAGPNPFRDRLNCRIPVQETGMWTVQLMDAQGRVVNQESQYRSSGSWDLTWDATVLDRIGSGMVFLRITSPSAEAVRRLVRLQ